uniref:Uncharacterized protein n=1 Tax=Ditylenchus dipsaci TaxID=166011 RepID=A0A915E2F1_9BILA
MEDSACAGKTTTRICIFLGFIRLASGLSPGHLQKKEFQITGGGKSCLLQLQFKCMRDRNEEKAKEQYKKKFFFWRTAYFTEKWLEVSGIRVDKEI